MAHQGPNKKMTTKDVFVTTTEYCKQDPRALLAKANPPVREDENRTIWTDVLAAIPELKSKLDSANAQMPKLAPIPGRTIKVQTAAGEIEIPAMQDVSPDTRPYKERLGTFRPEVEET